MKLIDLLDRSEQRQIKIIQLIQQHTHTVTIGQLTTALTSNRITIKDDLDLINSHFSELSDKLAVQLKNGVITLQRETDISASEIYFTYLKQSTKFKLLLYLLKHARMDTLTTSEALNISPSTLERRVRELNQLLTDFHLKIQNGKIIGSEIQVRHFYLQLLWFGQPYMVNEAQFDTQELQALVTRINQSMGTILSEAGIMKLKIYLNVVHFRRQTVPATFFTTAVRELHFHSHLFQDICQHLKQQAGTFKGIFKHPDELKVLFLFLIGNFCFNPQNDFVKYSLLYDLESNAGVAKVHRPMFQRINHSLADYPLSTAFFEKINVSLIQVHFRAVYLRGWLAIFGEQGIYDQLIDLPEAQFFNQATALCRMIVTELHLTSQDGAILTSEISGRYAAIYHLAFRNIHSRLTIGCDFGYEAVMTDILIDKLQQKIDARLDFTLERYNQNHQYDIIISNLHKRYPEQSNCQVFVMMGTEYNTDFKTLNHFIEKLYFKRLGQV